MSEPAVSWLPSLEAIAFIGIALQAAAVVWIWRDWKMSQFAHSDWRREHRQNETQTLQKLRDQWDKFGGPANGRDFDWDAVGPIELSDLAKEFPASSDDEILKKRKIDALTSRFGIGPNDHELVGIGQSIRHLALLRRGVADYRTFIRRKTFQTALQLMLIGFGLQLTGAWPTNWIISTEPSATNKTTQ